MAAMLKRSDLLFGYYGDCPTCIDETTDHTNMRWWQGGASKRATLKQSWRELTSPRHRRFRKQGWGWASEVTT